MTKQDPVELPLSGGWVSEGLVRIGDQVRKPAKSNSAFVAQLLAQLQSVGFDEAPRYLGQDDQARDILSSIPGESYSDCRGSVWQDEQLIACAALLRRFHACTSISPQPAPRG